MPYTFLQIFLSERAGRKEKIPRLGSVWGPLFPRTLPFRINEVAHAYRVNGTAELESFGERRWLSMLRDQSIAEDGRLRERGERGEGIVP